MHRARGPGAGDGSEWGKIGGILYTISRTYDRTIEVSIWYTILVCGEMDSAGELPPVIPVGGPTWWAHKSRKTSHADCVAALRSPLAGMITAEQNWRLLVSTAPFNDDSGALCVSTRGGVERSSSKRPAKCSPGTGRRSVDASDQLYAVARISLKATMNRFISSGLPIDTRR